MLGCVPSPNVEREHGWGAKRRSIPLEHSRGDKLRAPHWILSQIPRCHITSLDHSYSAFFLVFFDLLAFSALSGLILEIIPAYFCMFSPGLVAQRCPFTALVGHRQL